MVNTVSSHFSWLSGGFLGQFKRLRAWASHKHGGNLAGTFLCGDFNIKADSEGYQAVVRTQEYQDQFLAATSRNVFDKVFRQPSPDSDRYSSTDGRIDCVFMHKHSPLRAVSAREVLRAAIVTVPCQITVGIAWIPSRTADPGVTRLAAYARPDGP